MQSIGTFVLDGEIFTGTIHTLTLALKVNMIPSERTSAFAPDYRILCGIVEVGAGWKRTNAEGREFLSVKLDDPALPNPIYASLCQDDETGRLALLWSRPKGK
jgi:uncharacterized protein (DUF736 family)